MLSQHQEAAPAVQKHAHVHRCRPDDLDEECLGTLGIRFSAMGEFTQQMDIDLSNAYIESRLRTMQRNKLMLQYIDKAIKSMRAYAKNGEEFYWILYFKYLSSNEDICQTDGEVVEKLRERGLPVSSSTFYRRCNLAIDTFKRNPLGIYGKGYLVADGDVG